MNDPISISSSDSEIDYECDLVEIEHDAISTYARAQGYGEHFGDVFSPQSATSRMTKPLNHVHTLHIEYPQDQRSDAGYQSSTSQRKLPRLESLAFPFLPSGSQDFKPFAGPRPQFIGNGDSKPFAGPRSQFISSGEFISSGDSKPFAGPRSQFIGSGDSKPFAGHRSQFTGSEDSKPFAGPRSQFTSSGDSKPFAGPRSQFTGREDSKTFAGPRSQFTGSGDSKPFARPRSQFTGSGDSEPFAGPRSQFTGSVDSEPFAGPRSQFTGNGDSEPFAGPRSQFTGSGDSEPFAGPRSHFYGSGDSKPFPGPGSQFNGSGNSYPFAGPSSQFNGNGSSYSFAGLSSQFNANENSYPFAGPSSQFSGNGNSYPFAGPSSQFNGNGNSYPFPGPNSLNDKNHEKHTFEQDFMRSTPFPFGRSGSSADPVDPVRNGDEKLGGTDERSVFQQVIQDLHQPKQEAELPDGLLSVPLLRHQKIALAWMRQKEARPLCVGGMLADDQGLGKTISTIALIQMERYSEQKSKSKDHKNHKTVALTLDGNDDKGIISLDDVKPAKDLRAVKFISKGNHKTSALNLDDEDDDDDDQKGFVNLDEIKPEKDLNDVKFISKRNSSRQSSFKQRPAAGTLVVCPATVLRQWARELQDKVTEEAKLKVLIYHGSNRTKDPSELASYDVVLTTYALVANEVPKQPLVDEDDNGESRENNAEKSQGAKRKKKQSKTKKSKKGLDSFFVSEGGTLAKVRWLRVVLDEAQTIKNHRTQAARACCGLRAKKRWCLSGTPMQNTIDELFSYFRFLKYDPYSSYKAFREGIKIPISKNANSGYKKLQVVLRTVMLRRTKGTIVDGKPILSLPPKHINMNRLDLTSEERAFYTDLEHDSRVQFKAYDDAGTVNQNYANILVLLLRLRQACDHPYLCEAAKDFVRRIDSIKTLRQLPRATVNSLHNRLQGSVICRSCEDTPEEAIVTICGHIFCVQCMLDHLSSDENTCPATNCKEKLSKKVIFTKATFRCFVEPNGSEISSSRSNCNQHGEKMLSVSSSEYISSKIKTALEILQSLGKPSVDCIDLDGPAEDDAPKSDALVTVKTEIIDNRSTEERKKAIVFSQWTGMLDLMEASLIRHGIQYRRLDGTMNLAARDDAVREFNSDPQVDVMLMSLKAGNLGLNMVAACHVILLDLWWNPTTEDQAIDRAHRIGQTRAVTVSRLTVKDSVEDRILALQEKKRKIVASAYGEENAGGSSRLSVQDLRFLFMGA